MATINGVADRSAFISHIISYPVVSDSLNHIKQTPIGRTSLNLTNASIQKVQPLLSPLKGPYQKFSPYVAPYLEKVDNLGDIALHQVDNRIPAVKKPANELYGDAKGLAFWAPRKGLEAKDHVLATYKLEIKKVGGEGLVTYAKAGITTGLIVSSELLAWVANIAGQKKAEAKEAARDGVDAVSNGASRVQEKIQQ
jgi:hypothetical protein